MGNSSSDRIHAWSNQRKCGFSRAIGAMMETDLEGSLSCFTLSDILQLLGFSGQTGTLTLTQGWNSRTICFERGRLTHIAAATRLPTIGELLVHAGKLTEEQLHSAALEAARLKRDVTSTLVSMGLVSVPDLRVCRDQLLEETIYSLFLWRDCRFRFQSDVLDKTHGFLLDMTTERVVLDGTRRVDEWIVLSSTVPSMRMTFVTTNGADQSGESAESLTEQDLRVLAQIDGRRDGVAVSLACGLTQFEAARSLAQLSKAGLARAQPPERRQITRLFTVVIESMYIKLTMFGHAREALDFEIDLNRFARQHGLKVAMFGGKITSTDDDSEVDPTSLIDLYRLFIAVQQNRFSRELDPSVSNALVEGLYLHAGEEDRQLLRIYEFYHIEGLLDSGASESAGQ